MVRRVILLGLACGLMLGVVGCGPLCAVLCPGTMCGQSCGVPACGPVCGASCGPMGYADCAAPCDTVADRGPLDLVAPLFSVNAWQGYDCGGCTGCGETYFGDYPSACDPCDRCGNYTGGSCCR